MTSSARESDAKKKSRTSGAGPRLKNGGGVWSTPYTLVVGEDRAEVLHLLERLAGAAHHAGERIVGDVDRQAGFLHEQAVEVAQERAAAGQHHAFFGDVGAQFRRRLLERRLDRRDDLVQRLRQRFEDFVGAYGEAARNALGEVAAFHFHLANFGARKGGADLFLDQLGSGLADQHAVVAADVIDDRLVELVAADAHRARIHHAAQRDHAHLGRAAADVHDHRPGRLRDRQVGTDGRGHRLFDQVHLAGAGADRALADGAPLDLGRAARDTDDDARRGREELVVVHLLDELLEHLLGDGEVGYDAVLHRPDGDDVPGGFAEHLLRFFADRLDGFLAARAGFLPDRDDRRLIEDDALPAHINERVGGAEVDGQVVREVAAQESEHGQGSSLYDFMSCRFFVSKSSLSLAS